MYLVISSKKEIQIEALSLMGASTKRGQAKIGMFGTGNKYGIAYCMRNNLVLKIYSGLKEIKLDTVPKTLGENEFDVIRLNGKMTSLTTSLGKDWSLWMAIREFYSNAVDEGLIAFNIVSDHPKKKKGVTSFFIEANAEILELWNGIHNFIAIDREVLFENKYGKIYAKKSEKGIIFREGILVKQGDYKTLFDYDLHDIEITEERFAKYEYQLVENVWKLLYSCDNELVVRSIIDIGVEGLFEDEVNTAWYSTYSHIFSSVWKAVLMEKQIASIRFKDYIEGDDLIKTTFLSNRLYNDCLVLLGDNIKKPAKLTVSSKGVPYTLVDPTEQQQIEFDKAIKMLKDAKFNIPYEIKIVDFKNPRQVGGVNDKTILIGIKNFDEGDHYIANTIIEEYIHIKHQVADETRGFQTASINELVSYMKFINKL